MSTVTFSTQAYSKIIFHAVKYPHCAVNGLLLTSKAALQKKEYEIVDVVPLFHISLNLTPMAEIALIQVDEIASKKDLAIAGYYFASENVKECSFEKAHNRILDKLAQNINSPLLVVIDNSKLDINLNEMALKAATFNDGSFKIIETSKIMVKPSEKAIDLCQNEIGFGTHKLLIDFDNHLDNVALDWMNPEVNRKIQDGLLDFE